MSEHSNSEYSNLDGNNLDGGLDGGLGGTAKSVDNVKTLTNTASSAPLARIEGPNGTTLSTRDLPPADTKRWVIRRKAEVVAAVKGGLISLDEACQRYTLSIEEFLSWQRAIERHGLRGLRATRLQEYRPTNL